jgi:copper chaperone CopZ
MRSSLLLLALCLAFARPARATEPEKTSASTPKTNALITTTFYLTDVKCAACVSFLENSIRSVPGVQELDGLTETSGYARITFDPRRATPHQIAQAVTDTLQLHGEPFVASLKLLVPEYAQAENTAKVDALFARQKDFVTLECRNRTKGLFQLRFQPQAKAAGQNSSAAWRPDHLLAALKALGLTAQFVMEK